VVVDEPAEALFELAAVLGLVKPHTVKRIFRGDDREPGLAKVPSRPALGAIEDGLDEVPDHERVHIVIPRLGRVGRARERKEIWMFQSDL